MKLSILFLLLIPFTRARGPCRASPCSGESKCTGLAEIVVGCEGENGTFKQELKTKEMVKIVKVPAGTKGLRISLEATGDIDLFLDRVEGPGEMNIVPSGIFDYTRQQETKSYRGMQIYYSGDDLYGSPVRETIHVDILKEDLWVSVLNYEHEHKNTAIVTYSWDGRDEMDKSKCTDFSEMRTCKCKQSFEYVEGVGCKDIDACKTNKCAFEGSQARCVDLPAPALGDKTGFKCECINGFSGQNCEDSPKDHFRRQIAASDNFGCGIDEKGHVRCWGKWDDMSLPNADATFDEIACGANYFVYEPHCCGITSCTGKVECWKRKSDNTNVHQMPQELTCQTYKHISAGRDHYCAIRKNSGFVDCWGGQNQYNQLNAPQDVCFSSISAAKMDYFTCGIRCDDKKVMCWGDNTHDKTQPKPDIEYIAVSAGESKACAIRADNNKIECWGLDGYYDMISSRPKELEVDQIEVASSICARRKDTKTLFCWGDLDERYWKKDVSVVEISMGLDDFCIRRLNDNHVECKNQGIECNNCLWADYTAWYELKVQPDIAYGRVGDIVCPTNHLGERECPTVHCKPGCAICKIMPPKECPDSCPQAICMDVNGPWDTNKEDEFEPKFCRSTSDPHIKMFSGETYSDHQEGDILLFSIGSLSVTNTQKREGNGAWTKSITFSDGKTAAFAFHFNFGIDFIPTATENWSISKMDYSQSRMNWPTSELPWHFEYIVRHKEYPEVAIFVTKKIWGAYAWFNIGVRFSGNVDNAKGQCVQKPDMRRALAEVQTCKKAEFCCSALLQIPPEKPLENACLEIIPALKKAGFPNLYEVKQDGGSLYDNGIQYIRDGGNDMYDNGNKIYLDGRYLSYDDSCNPQKAGANDVRMDSDPFFQVTVVDYMRTDEFSISGNLGADGHGSVKAGSYEVGKGYLAFWKQVCDTSDPAIIHLWITNAENAEHSYSESSDNDEDVLRGVKGSRVIYILIGVRDESTGMGYCLADNILENAADMIIKSLTLNEKANQAYDDCIFDFSPNCCQQSDSGLRSCCAGALPSISCAVAGCSPNEKCQLESGFCIPIQKERTRMPTPAPTITPEVCEHTFRYRNRKYTVYSPRESNVDPQSFCEARGLRAAYVTDSSLYNSLRQNLRVWSWGGSPSCSGSGNDGDYTLYRGPEADKCYTMNKWYDFPHEIHCTWDRRDYGVLCQHAAEPYQTCSHTFYADGDWYTVYSPREKHVDGPSFCANRGQRFAHITSESVYDEIKNKLEVWTISDSPSCEIGESHTGWYTLYQGPEDSSCYAITDFYSFPHWIHCWSNHEDFGVLCRH